MEDACKQCSGWGESCSPDCYPDYCDPNIGTECAGYELKVEYKIRYTTHNNPEMGNCKFCRTLEDAERIKAGLNNLKHVSDVSIIKCIGNKEVGQDEDKTGQR